MLLPRPFLSSTRPANLGTHLRLVQLEDRVTPATLSLVQDINETTRPSDPQSPTSVNGTTYFTTTDLLFGTNLWKTDGNAAGTVRLTNVVRPAQALFSNLTAFGDDLLFASQGKLWASDGTPDGTGVIATFSPFSTPGRFAVLNGLAYFSASNGSTGTQLWATDGTAAGTSVVTSVNPSAFGGLQPDSLVAFNGRLYFSGTDGTNGTELWTSDGTGPGTHIVADLHPAAGNSFPTSLTVVGDRLYFAATDGTTGNQLWVSDGTGAGTARVTAINPSPFGGLAPTNLTAVNGKLLFAGDDGSTGRELWVSDGTTVGTTRVVDLRAGSAGSILPFYVTREIDRRLYFAANDGTHGVELWTSDGTPAGTRMVSDLWPGPSSGFGNAQELAGLSGRIYFDATDGAAAGLWSVDGATAGPTLVAASRNGVSSLNVVGSSLLFAADDITHGRELWISDGTTSGTRLIVDLNTATNSSGPRSLADINGRLFAVADTGRRGAAGDFQLHVTDGAVTTRLTSVSSPFGRIPEELTNVNGRLFFRADDGIHGPELWTSDGTAAGTAIVADINPNAGPGTAGPGLLEVAGGHVYFTTSDGVHGVELWVSDGTAAGTMMVADVFDGPASSFPGDLTVVDNQVYFIAQGSAGSGRQLWVSDGTPAGTHVVTHFPPAFDAVSRLWSAGGRLFFTANDGIHGHELWTSDGTAAGTQLYAELRLGPAGSVIREVVHVGGHLFLSGEGKLWTADGTPGGTTALAAIAGSFQHVPSKLTAVGSRLYFTAGDSTTGVELWTSDGTVAGTRLVVDLYPGSSFGDGNSSSPGSLTSLNGLLVFSAQDGVNGFQLWRTDGTPAGTIRVSGIAGSTTFGFAPANLIVSGGRLYFSANDTAHGNELWVASPPRVESVVVNDGSAQRSMVTSLTVTFSDAVTLGPDALLLANRNGTLVASHVALSVVGGKSVAVLTFAGPGVLGGSLADGTYELHVVGVAIHDDLGYELDGDDDRLPGGDQVSTLFRLFGDSDGNHDVDLGDVFRFLSSLGSRSGDANYRWYFDYDADGDIDVRVDLFQFLRRL